ncbi:MAG: hypothetical protein EOO38_06025 [Cytophagaceae bacterium]|nr:MAG: hypothetical protein EOO38_06025 [Cytophagaceae bacterium]
MTIDSADQVSSDALIDSLSDSELVAASGDPMALLVERLASILTADQWSSTEILLEEALASYSELLSCQ